VRAFRDAKLVLIATQDGTHQELKIFELNRLKYFVFRKLRYVYDESYSSFKVSNSNASVLRGSCPRRSKKYMA
jgi:hypothetical protein